MSTELKLTRIVAPNDLTCFRCLGLGIPSCTILTGETCVEIEGATGLISFACEDCFDRLNEEIETIKEEEAE